MRRIERAASRCRTVLGGDVSIGARERTAGIGGGDTTESSAGIANTSTTEDVAVISSADDDS